MKLVISPAVKEKLKTRHNVSYEDILECFGDENLRLLVDDRENNETTPKTQWFIGTTDHGKRLKVVLIFVDNEIVIKTAYPPNAEEERIYAKFA